MTSALVSNLYREWVLILHHQICSIFLSNICFVWSLQRVSVDFVPSNLFNLLSNICFGVWSLQFVSVDFMPPHLFDFSELSALISNLYRQWVLILCYQICLILLSNIPFGVWSLQGVSVDFVPPNLFDFNEWHLIWSLISTGSECWVYTIKSIWSCWVTSALVSDLYSLWVLNLYHQICLIFLSDVCFSVWSLQAVSVDFFASKSV